jgi:hypothetical protein
MQSAVLGPEALMGFPAGSGEDVSGFVTASAALIGLPIDPAFYTGVVESFRQLTIAANLVMSFTLADDVDPATVFHP